MLVPPTIEAGPTDVTVLYGQSAVLECESSGDPQPAVLWKKDSVVLDADDADRGYFVSPRGSLTISSAELTDSGDYTCTATNPAGVISRDIYLTVHGNFINLIVAKARGLCNHSWWGGGV